MSFSFLLHTNDTYTEIYVHKASTIIAWMKNTNANRIQGTIDQTRKQMSEMYTKANLDL